MFIGEAIGTIPEQVFILAFILKVIERAVGVGNNLPAITIGRVGSAYFSFESVFDGNLCLMARVEVDGGL